MSCVLECVDEFYDCCMVEIVVDLVLFVVDVVWFEVCVEFDVFYVDDVWIDDDVSVCS